MGLAVCTRSLIVALNRTRAALGLYAVAIVVNTVLGALAGWRGHGLVGIALSTLAASWLCSTQLLAFAFHQLGWSWRVVASRVALLYAPAAIAWMATVWLPDAAGQRGLLTPTHVAALRAVLWLGLAAAVAWRLRLHAKRDGRAAALAPVIAPLAGAPVELAL
jgi:peptidoglycan biosynthesis protein MviN/MurJ (putative lipid II flippase)